MLDRGPVGSARRRSRRTQGRSGPFRQCTFAGGSSASAGAVALTSSSVRSAYCLIAVPMTVLSVDVRSERRGGRQVERRNVCEDRAVRRR